MYRQIDNAGRIVIPSEMRRKLGLNNGDEVKFDIDNDVIFITNPKNEGIEEPLVKLLNSDKIEKEDKEVLEFLLMKYKSFK